MAKFFERIYVVDADDLGADMITVRPDGVYIVGSGQFSAPRELSRKAAAQHLRHARRYFNVIKLGAR